MTDDDCEWVCLTVPASAVVAALAAWHDDHEASARALEDVVAIPAHVMVETYSVLTRLPAGLAVPAAAAARVLGLPLPRGAAAAFGRRPTQVARTAGRGQRVLRSGIRRPGWARSQGAWTTSAHARPARARGLHATRRSVPGRVRGSR
ncbi:MAG: PIN domain-containing protein [Thermoleophilaceae bacterium]